MPEALASAFVAAEVAGMAREAERADARGVTITAAPPMEPPEAHAETIPPLVVDGVPQVEPRDAVEFFRGKVPLRSRTVTALVARARRRGTEVARTFLADVHGSMDEILDETFRGRSVQEGTRELFAFLESMGLAPDRPDRIETIVRTNMATAYNAGRQAVLDLPEVAEAFPFIMYRTQDDSAVRPEHQEMHEQVYRRGHPIWSVWWPPNGYNCRCEVVPVDREDLAALDVRVSRRWPRMDGKRVMPDEGFRFNGAQVFRTGSVAGLTDRQAAEARDVMAAWGRGRRAPTVGLS